MISVEFRASPALHERDNPPAQEPELELTLGPFGWVQLTYNFLRTSPDGDTIAAWNAEAGLWEADIESVPIEGSEPWHSVQPKADARVFSDIVISEVKG